MSLHVRGDVDRSILVDAQFLKLLCVCNCPPFRGLLARVCAMRDGYFRFVVVIFNHIR